MDDGPITPRRVAIIGSRKYTPLSLVHEYVVFLADHFTPNEIVIVSGGAEGPDTVAEHTAKQYGLSTHILRAKWDLYGKSAGFKRNTDIIEIADTIVAFYDMVSKGTLDSLVKAYNRHKRIIVYGPDRKLTEQEVVKLIAKVDERS